MSTSATSVAVSSASSQKKGYIATRLPPPELLPTIIDLAVALASDWEEKYQTFSACCHTPGLVNTAYNATVLKICLLDIFSALFKNIDNDSIPFTLDQVREAPYEENLAQLYSIAPAGTQFALDAPFASFSGIPRFFLSSELLVYPTVGQKVAESMGPMELEVSHFIAQPLPSGKPYQFTLNTSLLYPALALSGTWLAVTTEKTKLAIYTLNIVDDQLVTEMHTTRCEEIPLAVAASPNRLACSTCRSIEVFDSSNGIRIFFCEWGSRSAPDQLELSQDEQWFAILADGIVQIGNIAQRRLFSLSSYFETSVSGFSWVPETTQLVISVRKTLYLFDVQTQTKTMLIERNTWTDHPCAVGNGNFIFESPGAIYCFNQQSKRERLLMLTQNTATWSCNKESIVIQDFSGKIVVCPHGFGKKESAEQAPSA